jgi:hypothetical protein
MSSKNRKMKSAASKIYTAVENDPNLLNLLEITTSTGEKSNFIKALLKTLPTAFSASDRSSKDFEGLFKLFVAWFGDYPEFTTDFSRVNAALNHRLRYKMDNRTQKRSFIRAIGLDWTADDKSSFFSQVNAVYDVVRRFSFCS